MFFVSAPSIYSRNHLFRERQGGLYITNVVHLCFFQEMHHIGKGYYYWIIFLQGICWGIGTAGGGDGAHALSATRQGR